MYKRKKPYILNEDPGIKVYCGCGKTNTPPYCDESHINCQNGIVPYEVFIEVPKTVAICGCGKSGKMPFCDGSHECDRQV